MGSGDPTMRSVRVPSPGEPKRQIRTPLTTTPSTDDLARCSDPGTYSPNTIPDIVCCRGVVYGRA
jgi:hypothetical protein